MIVQVARWARKYEQFDEHLSVKIGLYNVDVTVMCLVTKCKQTNLRNDFGHLCDVITH